MLFPCHPPKRSIRHGKMLIKNVFLVYEMAKRSSMGKNDIWVSAGNDNVKHILSILDIKKMIPIVDGVYRKVDMNPSDSDTNGVKKYKDLLNKEYSFCLKVIDEVIRRANKLYDKQMLTGKVAKFCCDFKKLEKVAEKSAEYNGEILSARQNKF